VKIDLLATASWCVHSFHLGYGNLVAHSVKGERYSCDGMGALLFEWLPRRSEDLNAPLLVRRPVQRHVALALPPDAGDAAHVPLRHALHLPWTELMNHMQASRLERLGHSNDTGTVIVAGPAWIDGCIVMRVQFLLT